MNGQKARYGSVTLLVATTFAGGMAACMGDGAGGHPVLLEPGDAQVDQSTDAGANGLGGEAGRDASLASGDDAGISAPTEDGATVLDAYADLDAAPDAEADVRADAAADAYADASANADANADTGAGNLDASDGASSGLGVDCSPSDGGKIGTTGAPALLACTGLYSDFPARTIAPGVSPYDPGVHLWSDGAGKGRYVLLPQGAKIDTSNMDEWTFPVGTKFWKEFSLNGKNIETRYLYKTSATTWVWTTYQWSSDQTSATELTNGATNVGGTTYEIPDHDACRTCHKGRIDFVLGFEAIGLSTPMAKGLPMSALIASGLLTNPPAAPLTIPGDATASAALGWLHANCGNSCHSPSPSSESGWTGFHMRLSASSLASVQSTPTYTTGVNIVSKFNPYDSGALVRIVPGDAAKSCVIFRASHRDTQGEGFQMPPIDSHVVDTAGVASVTKWIQSL